jgi:hypothetical protein
VSKKKPTPDQRADAGQIPPAPPSADKPRRKWRRRLTILLLVLLVLIVVLRIAITLSLPSVLQKVAARYGLQCTYERSELTMLGGDFGIWHLEVRPAEGGEPLLHAGYCRGNLSTLALLKGKLDVWRVEADSVDLAVHRTGDGHIPVLERFLAGGQSTPPDDVSSSKPATPRKASLVSPLKVDAIRVERLRLRLKDDAVQPALDTTVQIDLRVSDLGSTVRPTRVEATLSAEGILDSLRLSVERRGAGDQADAEMRLAAHGLDLRPLEAYLRPFGLRPVANDINLRMRASAKVSLTAEAALTGHLALEDIAVIADGQEAASIGRLVLDMDSLDGRNARLARLAVETCRLRGMRTSQGLLRLAGIDLLPAPPAVPAEVPGNVTAQAATSSPSAAPATAPAGVFRCTLADLSVHDVRATFVDDGVSPSTTLEARLDSLSSRDLVVDSQQPDAGINVAAALQVPGAVRSVHLDAQVHPFALRKTAEVSVTADGIRPDVVKPYLDAAGLESLWKDGTLRLKASAGVQVDPAGRILADATVAGLDLRDERPLLAIETLAVSGASLDPVSGVVRVESVELAGPDSGLRQDTSGSFCLLGFRIGLPKPGNGAVSPQSQPSAPPPAPSSIGKQRSPRFEIGKLTWRNPNIRFEDERSQPPVAVTLADAGLELTDLSFDLDPAAPAPSRPGHLNMWLSVPDAARKIQVDGTFLPRAGAISLETTVIGEGITGAAFKPYLRNAGIEPVLNDGSLALKLKVDLAQTDGKLTSSLQVQDLRYADGDAQLVGLDLLRVADVVAASDVAIGAVEINRPRLVVSRQAGGDLVLAGMHLLPPENRSVPGQVPVSGVARPAVTATSAASSQIASPPPMATTLQSLRLRDASVTWIDQAVTPAVQATTGLDIDLNGLVLGRAAPPAQIEVTARVAGAIDQLSLAGTMSLSPDAQSARIEIDGQGLQVGPLAPYLPPGMTLTPADGRLKTAIQASVARHPEGGQRASLAINGLDWRDGPEGESLLRFDKIRLAASRIDPVGGVVALDEVSVSGLESSVTLGQAGQVRLLGLLLKPVPSHEGESTSGVVDRAPAAVSSQPAAASVSPAAASRKPLPLVSVQKLDLGVRRLSVLDQTRPGVAPVIVSELRLHNLDPIELGGPDPASRPPTRLQLTARCEPAAGQVDLTLGAAPFAAEPNAQLELAINGINGQGILSLMPGAVDRVASEMKEGLLKGHLEAQLKLQRRFPEDFNLSRGFELAMLLKGLEFRETPDGPVLAGLESLQVDGAAIWPATGGAIVKSLELSKPIGRLYRDKDGLHAMGFLVRTAAESPVTSQPTTEPAEAAATAPAVAEAPQSAPSPALTAVPPTRPAAEVRLDRLLVSGLDVVVEDRVVDPAVTVPLTGLDVEVRDLSNWAPFEDRPVRFSVLVNAGKADLPKKVRGAGIVGAVGDMAALMEGKAADTAVQYEQRELFSQVAASGRVGLYPTPNGWVKTSVSGFELVSLKGEARQAGVIIGSGTFDSTVDVRLPGTGSIETRSRLIFTDLTMSEPPNGPVVRYLHLSTPLDAVIKMLEGADGSITIPLRVSIEQGKVRGIAGAAVGALASVIATSIASAPVKVVGGVADVVGLVPTRQKVQLQPVVLTFLPGFAGLEPAEKARLETLIEQVRRDDNLELTLRHDLGGADIEMSQARSNLSPAQAAMLAYQLRARKIELAAQRSAQAGQTRALLASASALSASITVQRLRDTDRELAQNEDALDRVYELMRPGAERQASRRTRQACLDLARDRLQAVRILLVDAGIQGLDQRIRLTNPQVNAATGDAGGKVTITLIAKKRS